MATLARKTGREVRRMATKHGRDIQRLGMKAAHVASSSAKGAAAGITNVGNMLRTRIRPLGR